MTNGSTCLRGASIASAAVDSIATPTEMSATIDARLAVEVSAAVRSNSQRDASAKYASASLFISVYLATRRKRRVRTPTFRGTPVARAGGRQYQDQNCHDCPHGFHNSTPNGETVAVARREFSSPGRGESASSACCASVHARYRSSVGQHRRARQTSTARRHLPNAPQLGGSAA